MSHPRASDPAPSAGESGHDPASRPRGARRHRHSAHPRLRAVEIAGALTGAAIAYYGLLGDPYGDLRSLESRTARLAERTEQISPGLTIDPGTGRWTFHEDIPVAYPAPEGPALPATKPHVLDWALQP